MLNRPNQFVLWTVLLGAHASFGHQAAFATDYFLTIAGGYSPEGNQASLEANVLFFQQVLVENHRGPRTHDILFADGHDATADVQVLAPDATGPRRPATELLASLHRRQELESVAYRNHRVPNIAGALSPALIRARLEAIAKQARGGDRLIVYVTAHGSAGPRGDAHNTTIDCWNNQEVTAREFAQWLNGLPSDLPVLMVMAQCYCGGFADTIFNGFDKAKGPAPQLRAGFFAQQHDLPAAGCRPDIDNDEEFSSFFWGAVVGRSRTGEPISSVDIDGNGVTSFAEAYAHAVITSRTIDIPLRASDVLLRVYSRLTRETVKVPPADSLAADASTPANQADSASIEWVSLSGTLQSLANLGRPVSRQIVTKLGQELGFAPSDEVAAIMAAYDAHRQQGRGSWPGGRRRGGSGRRELLQEVSARWPELGDPQRWENSPLLRADNQERLLADLKQLPGWVAYDSRRRQRDEQAEQAEQHELREVKFRRLIAALELIVLERNLPQVATPEIVKRFEQMMALEESTLRP